MSYQATVTQGWTFATGDIVTAATLNAAASPIVTIPDNKSYVVAAGTVSAPSVAFNGDSDTGLAQLGGANTISFVVGGVEVARPTAQGIMFAVGSVSLPSVYFSGDPDTGHYWINSNKFGVAAGGANVGTWSATGLDAVGLSVGGLAVKTSGVSTATVSFSTDFVGSATSWGTTTTLVATGTVTASTAGSSGTDTAGRGFVGHLVDAVADRAVVTCQFSSTVGAICRTRLAINGTLSTGAQRYVAISGMFTALTVSDTAGAGAFFQYLDSAAAQWQTVTYDGSTRETQTTGVLVAAGTYVTFEVRRTATATFEFYINGVLVTTHTTVAFNSSTGSFQYAGSALEKLVGSGSRGFFVDSLESQLTLART